MYCNVFTLFSKVKHQYHHLIKFESGYEYFLKCTLLLRRYDVSIYIINNTKLQGNTKKETK